MKSNRSIRSRITSPLLAWVGLSLCGLAAVGHAQTTYGWQGTANNPRWSRPDNWLPAVPLGDGTEDLVFGNPAALHTGPRYNLVAPSTNFNSFTFTNGGWSLGLFSGAPAIRLGPGSITVEAQVTGSVSFGMPSFIDGPRTIANNAAGVELSMAADDQGYTWILNNQGHLVTLDGPGDFVFERDSGAILGGGGLTKNGSGSATLNGTNTFTGPITHNTGSLTIATVHAGNNVVTVADQTTIGVTVTEADSSLGLSSLTLGTTSNGTVTNIFNLGTFGNPATPVARVAALAVNATNYVNVNGLGLVVGQITLLKSTAAMTGPGTFLLSAIPAGREARLLVTADSVILDITNAPSLAFSGETNGMPVGVWDITGTSNWIDTSIPGPVVFQNGLSVSFDDTAATNQVILTTNVAPFRVTVDTTKGYTLTNNGTAWAIQGAGTSLTKKGAGTLTLAVGGTYAGATIIEEGVVRLAVPGAIGDASDVILSNNAVLLLGGYDETIGVLHGNGIISNSVSLGVTNTLNTGSGNNGVFSGQIHDGAAPLALVKGGNAAGSLTLSGRNTYSGGTTLQAGALVLGADNVLGAGPLIHSSAGNLTPEPGAATSRTLTNHIVVDNNRTFWGSPVAGTGPLTLSGPVDLGGLDRRMYFDSEVIFTGTMTNGMIEDRENPGPLTLRSNTVILGVVEQNLTLFAGTTTLDGARVTNETSSVYLNASNQPVRLVLTNNAVLTLANSGEDLRIPQAGDGTNIVDIHGSLILTDTDGNIPIIELGRAGARNVLNAGPSSLLLVGGIQGEDIDLNSVEEVHFDGATLQATRNNNNFVTGLDVLEIHNGGLTVDDRGFNIRIVQQMQGAGGLTKNGPGTLTLALGPDLMAHTYDGPTVVHQGTLSTVAGFPGSYPANSALVLSNGVGFRVETFNGTAGVQVPSAALQDNTLTLNYGSLFGVNPSAVAIDNPATTGTALAVNGINVIEVVGTGFAVGQFTLIDYSTRTGPGVFVLMLPPGVQGSLVDTLSTLDLNITFVPREVTWNGGDLVAPDATWDTAADNWRDAAYQAVAFQNTDLVTFEDSLTWIDSTNLNLTVTVKPSGVTFNNNVYAYTIGGTGRISGTTSLTKTGTAPTILNTANDYTGATTVGGGTLVLGATGSITGSTNIGVRPGAVLDVSAVAGYTLAAGQTLSGQGSIKGNVLARGTIAPGTFPGTLTFSNNLTLTGNVEVKLDRTGTPAANDVVWVGGTLAYGGTLTPINVGSSGLELSDSFPVFNKGGAGTIAVLGVPNDDPSLAWDFDETTGLLSVVNATSPELIVSVSDTDLTFSWTGPYRLVAQTNTLQVGLQPSLWFDYPDGTNGVQVPIVKTNPTVFFGLQRE